MKNVQILEQKILSDNWYVLKKITYQATQNDDSTTTQTREVYDRGNGACILLYNTEHKTVILTEQFRLPTYVNGNENGMLIECCAGLLDKDQPEDCIKRETEEETGYQVNKVTKVFEAYMSPGSVTELLYFFVAVYTPQMKVSEGGGIAEETENIKVLELPFVTALEMMKDGRIQDGKTIMLLQYALINDLLA